MSPALLNFIGYQGVWLVAVLGAGAGHWLRALLAGAVFAVAQLSFSRVRGADLKLVAVALVLGVLLDGLLSRSTWLQYATPAPALPQGGAPLWILVLWVAFALTLNHSLRWLTRHAGWAIGLGLIGGPLAYLGAARLSGAVTFTAPAWRAVGMLALGWAVAMAVLTALARAGAPSARGTGATGAVS